MVALVAALLLLPAAPVFARGGGGGGGHGGGGGGHGGGGGGHGGGGHGGGWGGGGSFSRGGGSMSGGSAFHSGGASNFSRSGNFTSHNFGSQSQVSGFRGTTGHNAMNGAGRSNFVGRNFTNHGMASNFNHGNWNHNNFNNFNRFGNFGYGFYPFGFFGGGWPWWAFGGYGGWGGYGGYGYGNYGYGNNGYGYNGMASYAAPTSNQQQNASDYASAGEQAFQAGQYQQAIHDWRHAMVDNPNNGGVVLLMAQALFAVGQYNDAAGAVQMGMQMVPENEWGTVGKNYTQIYPNIQNYTDQLKTLERARDAKPDDPAIRFLLGYHFGYLGYPKQAVRELDKALDLQPKDLGAQKLRDIFAVQAGLPARPHTATEQPPAANPAPGNAPGTGAETPRSTVDTGTPA
jgi:hypothetical protein